MMSFEVIADLLISFSWDHAAQVMRDHLGLYIPGGLFLLGLGDTN
jgi:hypothetical protein